MAKLNEKPVYAAQEVEAAIVDLSHRISKDCLFPQNIAFIGIATGGVPLAQHLVKRVGETLKTKPLLGILDITFYRDDIALRERHPVIKRTDIPFSLDQKYVVLVDDVLFSGRTVRAAMDALVDFGRPEIVRLCVMVDRGHRELPIHADFSGFTLKTEKSDQVRVTWKELGADTDAVYVDQRRA